METPLICLSPAVRYFLGTCESGELYENLARSFIVGIVVLVLVLYFLGYLPEAPSTESANQLIKGSVKSADPPSPPTEQPIEEKSRPFMESFREFVSGLVEKPSSELTPQQPTQPFSDSGPVKGMALRLKRGEKAGGSSWLGRPIGPRIITFTLDARMEVSAEIRSRIEKYGLGGRLIYESANREKYAQRALQHAEYMQEQPSFSASAGAQAWGFAKQVGRLTAAVANATFSALSLRVTVNSLMEGHHIECKDMIELLEAEEAMEDAARNLKAVIDMAATFSGDEERIVKIED
jgi:hypothetical protein